MIIFRADGNKKIGAGHVMRCLSIADALRDRGHKCVFVTADDSMSEVLKSRDYENVVLNSDYQKTEDELKKFTSKEFFDEADGIVVDSYYATDNYLEKLSRKKKTVYVDDLSEDRPVNAIINYNIFADKEAYLNGTTGSARNFILGPSYAPLRKSFQNVTPIEIKESVEKVLFLAGGADPEHAALGFAKEVLHHKDRLCYKIVAGALSEDFDEIKQIAEVSEGRITVLKNVQNMDELMLDSEIAISAAGSTLYELCACGVPTISYVLADNQIPAANSFEQNGAMLNGGDLRKSADSYERLYSLLTELAGNAEKRKKLAKKARNIVDGKGADRLAEEIERIFCR